MSKKILFIAYTFPPIGYGGSHRTIRLCKYLKKLDYEIDVLTINIQKDIHNDYYLLDKVREITTIHRTTTIDIWRLYNRKFKTVLLKTITGKILNKFISFFMNMLNQPDHMVFWIPFATCRGYQLIKKKNLNHIYTSSPPHSQLITGFLLKKLTGVRWIADLRDPITFNIAVENWGPIEKYAHSIIEKITIKNADAVITNTEAALYELRTKFPQLNGYHISNSFDSDDFKNIDEESYQQFTISHLGTLYYFRNTEPLLQAISELDQQDIINPKNFTIKFIGITNWVLEKTIARYGLHAYIETGNMVCHREAIRIMTRSHMLLLLKGFNASGFGQVPGKLYEYIGTKKPILYIGPSGTEASAIVNDVGNSYVVENDVEKIKKAIHKEYISFKQDKSQKHAQLSDIAHPSKYTSEGMALKFHKVFSSFE